MKVLITGGAGFIGSHLADKLLDRGDHVLVIDNYNTGRRDNLTPHSRLTEYENSIEDTEIMYLIFNKFNPEIVIHAAASYKNPFDWFEDAQTNVLGTINVVKAAMQVGVRRLIYFQTALCYGLQPVEQPVTLNHPISPQGSSYAISKTVGEQYIQLSGLEYISFRLANIYGPRNLSGPLPTFYHRLTNDKPCFVIDTRRDFIYIEDLLDVVLKAIDGVGISGPYHVSSGIDYSIEEIFNATIKALDITLETNIEVRERNLDDAFRILLDPTKTNKDFKWATGTPLKVGVQAAIDWYRRFDITQTYTHLVLEEKPSW